MLYFLTLVITVFLIMIFMFLLLLWQATLAWQIPKSSSVSPKMMIGDFYVFPYEMRHCVYPFNLTKETRRTLVCNVDVDYNPVASRTGSGMRE